MSFPSTIIFQPVSLCPSKEVTTGVFMIVVDVISTCAITSNSVSTSGFCTGIVRFSSTLNCLNILKPTSVSVSLLVVLPLSTGPVGSSLKSKVITAILINSGGQGANSMVTLNFTITVCPGCIVPIGTPILGFAPGCTTPLTVTLLATSFVPSGIWSLNMTFSTGSVLVFVIATVYVRVSPTLTADLSAVFTAVSSTISILVTTGSLSSVLSSIGPSGLI